MIAVGLTGPNSVRLWMRTDVRGPHELQIVPFGNPGGAKTVRILTPPPSPGDNTFAVTYPDTFDAQPLEPLRRYSYRITRVSDGEPLGEGTFETAPARDADTPEKVVIATMSCHQPFTSLGTIAPESERMMRLLPRILKENDTKFVLLTGDQIYSDDPHALSMFSNPLLLPRTCTGKSSILDCSIDEIRRAYDERYRTLWSPVPIRKMYANYPCYPAIDDHEIMDDWGSCPEHSDSRFQNVWQGSRLAYYDYQALRVLRPVNGPTSLRMRGLQPSGMPPSFHYNFSYGYIGVFVMDIRSARVAASPNQLYSPAQLADLRRFLQDNAQKKVLLIVVSVPVVHLPSWLAELGHSVTGPKVDFMDHWSCGPNIPARDAFLEVLHRHQQANPEQRVILVSGDVHVSCAFAITWRGGNLPRLYQFTSSPITNLFTGWRADLSKVGPHLVSGISCPGKCSGSVRLLSGVPGAGTNPLARLNLGLIEVIRIGGVPTVKLKLIGTHPREDRPVTYFESGYI